MEVKRILWPTDFSKNAAHALPYVTSLTDKYQTEIHLLYVMEALKPDIPWYGELDPAHLDKIRKWEENVAKKHLDDICDKYLDGCPKYVKHIKIGDPAQEILRFIKKENVNMVVMAKHGRKGHFRIGSVSRKVMENSLTPVVTIPISSKN
ncbi:MAG: universal stress protein [Deltaproteobacteria bacterium]|nr:universal stress protein [Deltaproteobacteria bacterium]MBW2173904.1 universal stress protein [Deltaproteobacteria bacterium]